MQTTRITPRSEFLHRFEVPPAAAAVDYAATIMLEFEIVIRSIAYVLPTIQVSQAALKVQIDDNEAKTYQLAMLDVIGTSGKRTVTMDIGHIPAGSRSVSLITKLDSTIDGISRKGLRR